MGLIEIIRGLETMTPRTGVPGIREDLGKTVSSRATTPASS
jgi:hypothetical protein